MRRRASSLQGRAAGFIFLVPGAGWESLSLTHSRQQARTQAKVKGNLDPFPSLLLVPSPSDSQGKSLGDS